MGAKQRVEQEITASAVVLSYAEKMVSKKMFDSSKLFKEICVFCGSSSGMKGVFSNQAFYLGRELLQISITFALFSRRCVEQTCMISFLIFSGLLSMARTAEAANSTSSVQATTTSGETTLDWVKITVVPLGVFLFGACVWGIIADTTARWWSSFRVPGGGPPEAEEVPARRHINNGSPERDLEEGLELAHHVMEDDLAMAPNPRVERDGTDDAT